MTTMTKEMMLDTLLTQTARQAKLLGQVEALKRAVSVAHPDHKADKQDRLVSLIEELNQATAVMVSMRQMLLGML